MALDAPLMHNILTLPLEHLCLWNVKPDGRTADQTFHLITAPRIKLRSLVLLDDSWRSNSLIPINWVSQLIGTTMRDLSLDASELVPPALPVLPDLEVLEFPAAIHTSMISPSMLYGLLSKTPNLKETAVQVKATPGDPADTIPALSHLERVMCHGSWLHSLVPGRPITTAKVLCDSQVRVRELFETLHEGNVPLRDLALTYAAEWGHPTWSPDDLEPVARCLPELETFRLHVEDYKLLEQGSPGRGLARDESQRVSRFKEIAGFGES
ncbi:hypothetical protein FRC00_006742 [Tulasnella sp. 408]|nr:hypothetical protein FRC00_006742 [Tulasnella sp. 408]